jgi:hypothetical protein
MGVIGIAIEVVWDDDEKTILRWVPRGNLNIDEFQEGISKIKASLDEAEGPLALILDERDLQYVSPAVIGRFPDAAKGMSGRLKLVIVVGARGFAETLGKLFARVYTKLEFVSTLEEAYALIADSDM